MRNSVAIVNNHMLRKHGHKISTRIGEFYDESEEAEFVGIDHTVPARDPIVSRQLLAQARFDLVMERNGHLLELNGILEGSSRSGIGLETKLKGLMEQLKDLGTPDPNDPIATERSSTLNRMISATANEIFARKNSLASLNAKIKDVDERIQKIDDNENLEKRNVLARDERKKLEAKDKKAALAKQQRDLEEAKKNKGKKVASVSPTPFTPTPPSDTPFGPQPPIQAVSQTTETKESGGGLGLAIGLAVVGTAIAVASQS